MGFLAPWFLAGLAALSIPLWLHLLQKLKRDPQLFPSLMFFAKREQSSVRQRRLRYIALLVLRLLALLLLALAFADPYFERTRQQSQGQSLTVIALDRSFSMRYASEFAEAKRGAKRLVEQADFRGPVEIMAVDSRGESVTGATHDKQTLLAAIESLQPTDRASSFGNFVHALASVRENSGMPVRAHLFSDMQETSMPADFHELILPPQTTLELHNTAATRRENRAVLNVTAPARAPHSGKIDVSAAVKSWSSSVQHERVSLSLDGNVLQTRDIEVPANGQVDVGFSGIDVPYGAHRGEVALATHDELPQDDRFPFSVGRAEAQKVLFLSARSPSQQSFYYKAALESGGDSAFTVESRNILAAAGLDFSTYAFVVLHDSGEMPKETADALCRYVQRGGALLVALGPATAAVGKTPVLGDALSLQPRTQGARLVESSNPALFGTGRLENVVFRQTVSFSPKPGVQSDILARLADGTALLAAQQSGEGRVLLFGSLLDNSISDFVLHSSYVPFVVQTARYLSGAEDAAASAAIPQIISLRKATGANSGTADVVGPDGHHELTLEEASRARSYEGSSEGFYQVRRADGRNALVALHADRRESDLRSIPDETLTLWRNTGVGTDRAGTESGRTDLQRWTFGRYLIAACLVAILGESLLANRYATEERRPV